jgi:transcriptional regulator with PAS, ATPase and Fis domain
MMEIARLIKEVSAVDVPVLITGESGTGKELVARSIHSRSARKDKPFLAINCAALPESLQESELFGHAKGAFTGAGESKKGLFEEADGGTLLLDEIGEMGPGTQVKLLRVLQDGEVRQVGSTHSTHVNIRILSSTNQPFSALTDQNRFRRDLLFRINVVRIHLPPLRERADDLPLLVDHFVSKFSERYQKPVRGVDADAMRLLRHHDWPGNIRELENCLKRSVILCAEPTIRARDLEALDTASGSGQAGGRLDEQEKGLILEALHRHGWNQKRTAVELGIGVTTLWRKIKKYGLTRSESPPA